MSTEETSLLSMSAFKENAPSQQQGNAAKDDNTVHVGVTSGQTPTQKIAIQPSSSGQQILSQHTSTPTPLQPKQEPVTIHPAPHPIQPAPPMTPQHAVVQPQNAQVQHSTPLRPNSTSTTPQTTPAGKPPVGSEEWHRQRRENHKEVERRRRDTINAGINELAKIVPGCEKNKGSILNRAVQYIQQLKENEAANIEKWTLEKLLTDQAIQDLQAQLDMLKAENGRLRAELEETQQQPTKKKQRTE